MQKVQNAAASFVRKSYSRKIDVIGMNWLPVKERSEYSLAKLAWKSVNANDWPKFLPMEKYVQPITRNDLIGGTKLREISNVNGSLECEAPKIFNELPITCRNSTTYKNFRKETKKYFIDKALAKELAI